jgi:hypothetical protein
MSVWVNFAKESFESIRKSIQFEWVLASLEDGCFITQNGFENEALKCSSLIQNWILKQRFKKPELCVVSSAVQVVPSFSSEKQQKFDRRQRVSTVQ